MTEPPIDPPAPAGGTTSQLVAGRVRGLLAERRMNGVQLAELAGWSPPMAARRLRGEVDFTVPQLLDIVDILEVTVNDILDERVWSTRRAERPQAVPS